MAFRVDSHIRICAPISPSLKSAGVVVELHSIFTFIHCVYYKMFSSHHQVADERSRAYEFATATQLQADRRRILRCARPEKWSLHCS